MFDLTDIIFSICGIVLLFAYLSENILTLRLLNIVGLLGYVVGACIAGHEIVGMKSLIFFSIVNILINIYQSAILILERVPIFLPENVKQIYTNNFAMMSTAEFNKIYKCARIKKYRMYDVLSVQGMPINELIIIVHGNVHVAKDDLRVATRSSGDFIGELSFILGGHATASVEIADEQTECIVWKREELIKKLHDQPQLYLKFKQAIALNLVKKLNAAHEPA
jgi:hypothetical protein